MEKTAITIFNPALARILLKQGYKIIDIKPNREDEAKTVFIFKIEDGILDFVKSYNK